MKKSCPQTHEFQDKKRPQLGPRSASSQSFSFGKVPEGLHPHAQPALSFYRTHSNGKIEDIGKERLVVSNLVVCNLYAEVLFCALLQTCVCALLRSFARICVFLQTTAFRTTAFGNSRKKNKKAWNRSGIAENRLRIDNPNRSLSMLSCERDSELPDSRQNR